MNPRMQQPKCCSHSTMQSVSNQHINMKGDSEQMKRKLLVSIMSTMCLCLSACVPRETEPGVSEETSSPSHPIETPYFTKIEVGGMGEIGCGVFALDSAGELYVCSETGTIEVIESQVKDFSYSSEYLYILKENGDLLSSGDQYWRDKELILCYSDKEIESISNSVMILSDQGVLHYHFNTDSWNPVDISALKMDAGAAGAAIIDTDHTLWYLDRSTEELQKIADDVIDCSFSYINKTHYSTDIWYVTEDHTMHLHQTLLSPPPAFTDEELEDSFPTDVVEITAYLGTYLAKSTDGTYLTGSSALPSPVRTVEIAGQDADVYGGYYAILGQDGNIYFGEIPLAQPLIQLQVFCHP